MLRIRFRMPGFLCWMDWRIAGLLLALNIFFYWKIIFTRQAMFPWDAGDFFYPYLAYVHEELRHFRLPLWLPYAFSGFPIIADPEGQIFYPPNWLMVLVHPFAPLPFRLVEIQIVVHYFLAGLFMFHLARDFTRDTLSALFGGILFMFSGAMVAHAQHMAIINANAWFPLVFLLARRGLLENQRFYTLGSGVFFGVEILTGHLQHAVLLGLLLFLYFGYEACVGPNRAQLWPRWMLQLAVIAAIGAGLGMVQLLPTAELSPLSIRTLVSHWDVTQGNLPAYLWTLFLPNYFGGINGVPSLRAVDPTFHYAFLTVPGCLLALVGLIEMARRKNFFWLGLILVCSILAMGKTGYLIELVYYVPILNLFRHAPMYFDLANFGLCLMAATGIQTLWDRTKREYYRPFLPLALMTLLLLAILLGVGLQFATSIPGWSHMLLVLAVFTGLVAGMLHGPFPARWSQHAVIAVVVSELFIHGMNQRFNSTAEDPWKTMSYDYEAGRKETLQFLRSDHQTSFRVAAFGESQLSNGWNVWRIPGIYGWNPIMLRRYQEYIRQFTHNAEYAQPYAGPGQPDHSLDSPMLDLLGVKYLVVTKRVEEQQRLIKSNQFEKVFSDLDWWKIYRNKDHVPGPWFLPSAYVLPDTFSELALMNTSWFEPRKSLLIASEHLRRGRLPRIQELPVILLRADQVATFSTGAAVAVNNNDCAEPDLKFAYWAGKGGWIRFEVEGPPVAGRYLLLMQYTAPEDDSSLVAEIAKGSAKRISDPVRLPKTWDWNCKATRSAQLGEFELGPGTHELTLTLTGKSDVALFSLWLVRVPEPERIEGSQSAFENLQVSANRISFGARLSQDGYVFLNEIHYPGWTATIDAKPAEILRANTIFRALWVPAGSHRIEFRFWSRFLILGATISLATLTVVGLALAASSSSVSGRREHRRIES